MTPSVRAKFYEALELYNRGEYLDAQERLDEVYADSEEGERLLVRGILALSCGMYLHFRYGGGRGVLNLLRQSLVALDELRPRHLGVDTEELYAVVEAYLQDLQERRKAGARFLDRWLKPRIRYSIE